MSLKEGSNEQLNNPYLFLNCNHGLRRGLTVRYLPAGQIPLHQLILLQLILLQLLLLLLLLGKPLSTNCRLDSFTLSVTTQLIVRNHNCKHFIGKFCSQIVPIVQRLDVCITSSILKRLKYVISPKRQESSTVRDENDGRGSCHTKHWHHQHLQGTELGIVKM